MIVLFTTILWLTVVDPAGAIPAARHCRPNPSDIAFVLDSSSSIWPEDFVRQLQFVENITQTFDIGLKMDETRVGIMTFSHKLRIELLFKDNRNKSDVISAIRHARYLSGGTSTAKALKALQTSMFLPKYGARRQVKKIAIVITDGMSYNRNETKRAADSLRDMGTTLFAVGVGRGTDLEELGDIADTPTDQFVFQVPTFQALSKILTQMSDNACRATLEPVHGNQTRDEDVTRTVPQSDDATVIENCGGKPADVYFLLDSSSSIRTSDYRKQLGFVKDVVAMFDISENKTRIGVSTFSHRYKQEFDFQSYFDKRDIINVIDKLSYLKGGTDTAAALRNIRLHVFTPGVVRQEVAHVLVVITDGFSRSPQSTENEAALLRQMGVYVFAIGVAGDVDPKELQSIASVPEKGVPSFIFNVFNFDALETIKKVLAIRACELVDTPRLRPVCRAKKNTDVLFLMDASSLGSTMSANIIRLINDSIKVTKELKTSFQYGVVAASCSGIQDMALSRKFLTAETLNKQPNLELARLIKKSRSSGFLVRNGGRPTARRVIFVFLNNALTPEAEIEIQRARETGIDFIFVTIEDVETKCMQKYVRRQQHVLQFDQERPGLLEQTIRELLCEGMA